MPHNYIKKSKEDGGWVNYNQEAMNNWEAITSGIMMQTDAAKFYNVHINIKARRNI